MSFRLTQKQQLFVDAILAGKTQVEAYRLAGFSGGKRAHRAAAENKEADRKAQALLRSRAARVARGAAVERALALARARISAKVELTVEDLVAQLLETRELALSIDPPQCSASAACTMGIGKLLGLWIDRKQVGIVHHKPGLSAKAVELTADEWKAQFTPRLEQPDPAKSTP